MTIPSWLREPHQNVLLALKLQGGKGNIGDIRRAGQKEQGDPVAQKLIKHGLLRGGRGTDFYHMTPEGYDMARCIEAAGKLSAP